MANDRRIKYASFAWTIIDITLIIGLVEIVMLEGLQVDQYLGCFYDGETQREAQNGFSNATLTIDMCTKHCRHMPSSSWLIWSFAILQTGTDCRCSNNYGGRQVQDSFCNKACGGNASEYCGGTNDNGNLTYVLYAVCPIGTYGLMCDEACHCKSQVPCDRQRGRCPDGCHGNYTGEQCNQSASFSDQYIGCYKDIPLNRAMEKRYESHRNTLQYCLHLCFLNYSYAAPQFAYECWCGESYDKHGRIVERLCNSPCNGNKNQFCGGADALSVYSKCPTGNYGAKCAKVCNCEGRCHVKNGTCLMSGCKPGWTGDACDIRDCRYNNGDCASFETCTTVRPAVSLIASVCRCKPGYWRSGIWGACTDIDECSDIPNICGPLSKFCNNSESGFTCYCKNGNLVQNSACKPDHECSNDLATTVGAILGSIILLLSAILIVIVILYWRTRKRIQSVSSVASTVRSGKKSEEKLTKMNRNVESAENPESEESTYVGLGNRTADDNRVYDALQMDDYANP